VEEACMSVRNGEALPWTDVPDSSKVLFDKEATKEREKDKGACMTTNEWILSKPGANFYDFLKVESFVDSLGGWEIFFSLVRDVIGE
jgi:hypothetical protein